MHTLDFHACSRELQVVTTGTEGPPVVEIDGHDPVTLRPVQIDRDTPWCWSMADAGRNPTPGVYWALVPYDMAVGRAQFRIVADGNTRDGTVIWQPRDEAPRPRRRTRAK